MRGALDRHQHQFTVGVGERRRGPLESSVGLLDAVRIVEAQLWQYRGDAHLLISVEDDERFGWYADGKLLALPDTWLASEVGRTGHTQRADELLLAPDVADQNVAGLNPTSCDSLCLAEPRSAEAIFTCLDPGLACKNVEPVARQSVDALRAQG